MKVCVIIPSHINYTGQICLLDKCLESLFNQEDITTQPDIYISASFSNKKYKKSFNDIIKNGRCKGKENVSIRISKIPLYQMEHIQVFLPVINDYDLVMFSDDDDLYEKRRISVFVKGYEQITIRKSEIAGVVEFSEDNRGYTEYWRYALKPETLRQFYERMEDSLHLLKHRYGDYFLGCYLKRKTGLAFVRAFIDDGAKYLYNVNNPNSILGKHERGLTPTTDALWDVTMLSILSNDLQSECFHFLKFLEYSSPKENGVERLESLEYIRELCKTLFD